MPPGNVKRRLTGMCECSATHSESKPRSSSACARSADAIEYSVKKIDAPTCMTALLMSRDLGGDGARPLGPVARHVGAQPGVRGRVEQRGNLPGVEVGR